MKLTIVGSYHDINIRCRCKLGLNSILQHTKASLDKGGTEVHAFRPQGRTHPNPKDGQAVMGEGEGGRWRSCARTRQPMPIGSLIKVINCPTDRLREQTKSGQLKAQVHQRLHRPKWHTMKQLKCRVVRPPRPVPARTRESALTSNYKQRRPARRCAMRSSRWHTETAARTS